MREEQIRKIVRQSYAKIVKEENSCRVPVSTRRGADLLKTISKKIGYTNEELKAVPKGANLGLGCENPIALASLKEGKTVLDLGSGAGLDCFLAAKKVGKSGKVIGVDMTPEMIERARENAKRGKYKNVEFRLGEIENIPAADNSVDIVISNCVINLSPDKRRVFTEAYRVLKPGGRLMISDIVLSKKLPSSVKNSVEAYVGCISGAIMREKYLEAIRHAGFREVNIVDETSFPIEYIANDPTANAIIKKLKIRAEDIREMANSILSIKVCGIKPKETTLKIKR